MTPAILLALTLGVSPPAAGADAEFATEFERVVRPFLESTCIKCHGPEKQKSGRRFDQLSSNFSDPAHVDLWSETLDQLNLGEMPPEDQPKPPPDVLRAVVAWIDGALEKAKAKSAAGQVVMRRLNATEYQNTVRDLFALDIRNFHPAEAFPKDISEHGFDNIGEDLVTSGFLLEKYLEAADKVVEKAVHPGPAPNRQTYTFYTDDFLAGSGREVWRESDRPFTDIVSRAWYTARVASRSFAQGVPHDGHYFIRVKAAGIDRKTSYPDSLLRISTKEPIRMAVRIASGAYGDVATATKNERVVATFEVADDEPRVYEARVWMDKGFTPVITYPNGPGNPNGMGKKVNELLGTNFPRLIHRESKARIAFRIPRLRIWSIEVEGPFFDVWPPPSHRKIFGDKPTPGKSPGWREAEEVLTRFAARAFRRPLEPEDLTRVLAFVRGRLDKGDDFFKATKAGLKAMLCSPAFLFLREPEGRLDDHAVAARLSYFLWNSTPDELLLKLAARGQLSNASVLAAQVRRMLSDPKSESFVNTFVDQWLGLRRLGAMPPDEKVFDEFYFHTLEPAMVDESRLFFRHLLDRNLPIANFIDSKFTFVNDRLAKHYGIEGVTGPDFRRVSLKPEHHRGGLLGQGSILTVTSNGVETSPVIRGVWVLENIFGRPPSPPPPDVKPIEPDIRGATTVREQLSKHRDVEACRDCHARIDPYGFAFERFDPIGAWRAKYPNGREIDTSGVTPGGQKFRDERELKDILLAQKDQFVRCLVEKLLVYATGRRMTPADRPTVDRAVKTVVARGYGLRDVVLAVVGTPVFLNK